MAARKPKATPAPVLVQAGEGGRLVALVNLLVDRPDLGPGVATLVAAGDPVPPGLEPYPRRAA